MHYAMSYTPLNFAAHLGYNIIRSGDEDQLSSLCYLLGCMANTAIGHQPR